MNMMNEKMARLDANYQNALKEKNQLIANSIAKEKEIADLAHKQHALRTNVF